MTSNFAFHPTVNEVVPYSARYAFPNQATRQSKRTVKMTPKNNAQEYVSGSTIRFEFPASGYLNPNTTYLAFNCRVNITAGAFSAGTTTNKYGGFEFQNNIQSIFRRVRVLYGSLVLEDIQDYNIVQRLMTDLLIPSGTLTSTTAMYQGIGHSTMLQSGVQSNLVTAPFDYSIQRFNYHATAATEGTSPTNVGTTVRRYMVPINTGVFQQKNLIPLKFMASQLQVEFEIADAVDCVIWTLGVGGTPTVPTACQVSVGQPEIVAELLEFDSEFDAAVYDILGTGLPIYFQSYHVTTQNVQPSIQSQLNIQESSRSVRYALAAIYDDTFRTLRKDAHVTGCGLYMGQADATIDVSGCGYAQTRNGTNLDSYQWRLGGTYYPSQPVPCYAGTGANITAVDANYADPPVEAYAEVMKVFGNLFGDDGTFFGDALHNAFGNARRATGTGSGEDIWTQCFVMAGNFLSDRGDVISGINAEEQNDLQLILKFVGTSGTAATGTTKTVKIIVCYDNLMILGENNNMVLVN